MVTGSLSPKADSVVPQARAVLLLAAGGWTLGFEAEQKGRELCSALWVEFHHCKMSLASQCHEAVPSSPWRPGVFTWKQLNYS